MQIVNAQGDVMSIERAIVDNWDAVVSRGIGLTRSWGAAQFACHIPRESGEGRLVILNFKRRSMVTVEVKDLGEVNEG